MFPLSQCEYWQNDLNTFIKYAVLIYKHVIINAVVNKLYTELYWPFAPL